MNKDKVFIGYTKEGKRSLLYKNKEDKYIDLETKDIYKSSDVIEKTLVNYNELIKLHGYSSAKRIKKKYQEQEEQSADLKNIFIGDIVQVTKILKNEFNVVTFMTYQEFDAYVVSPKHLLERQYDNSYKDLLTNEVYNKEYSTDVGYLRVSENSSRLIPFNIACEESSSQLPKKKVLKKYQDKYGLDSYK